MARIRDDIDIRDIAQLYESGKTISEVAKILNCGKTTVARRLIEAGIKIRSTRKPIPIDEIIAGFNSGESVKSLSERYDIARSGIVRRLIENGVTPRNRSEGMYARMAATSSEERMRLSAAAHSAVKGKSRTEEELIKRAQTKEWNLAYASRIELAAGEMLLEKGFKICAQKAIGKYNVDLAICEPPIAVEIFGGNWHASGLHATRFNERVEYILDSGWNLVIIWVIRDYPLESGAIDYIVALAEKLRSAKPARGEKHVIRGDGNYTTIGASNLKYRPIIPGSQPRDNITGRFTSRIR